MRKLIVNNPVSLDGYYEGRKRSIDAFDEPIVEGHLCAVVEHTGGFDTSFNAFSIDEDRGTPWWRWGLRRSPWGSPTRLQTQFLAATAAARYMRRRRSGVILAISATPACSFPTSAPTAWRVPRSSDFVDN